MKRPDLQYWGKTKVTFNNCQEILTPIQRAARRQLKLSSKDRWKEQRKQREEKKMDEEYKLMIDLPYT